MASVSLSKVNKRFGDSRVLSDISLDVRDREFLSLVGPSGCGKSTLLRLIAGLETETSGSISIGGTRVDGLVPKERDIAMVFQSYALYPYMTVAENIALPLIMRYLNGWQRLPLVGRFLPGTRQARRTVDGRVRDIAETLGLTKLLDRRPAQLSGGQRQRVAVGRAMVREPAAFLMDEPLSNLDAKLRVQMRAEIAELHRRLGTTFIYVTHDQSEAMTMSDRVAVMMDGVLLQVGPPHEVYSDPADLRVASFIGSPRINRLSGVVCEGDRVSVGGITLSASATNQLAPGTKIVVCIRPEALQITHEKHDAVIAGRIRMIEDLGADLFVHLDVPGESDAVIVRAAPGTRAALERGAIVHLCVPNVNDVLLFDPSGRRIRSAGIQAPALSDVG